MADDAAARRAASAGALEAQKAFAKACANSLEWHYKAAQRAGAPPPRPTILESDSKRPGWYEPPDATAAPPRVERRAEATDMQNQIDAVEFGLKQLRASADEPPDASVLERLRKTTRRTTRRTRRPARAATRPTAATAAARGPRAPRTAASSLATFWLA